MSHALPIQLPGPLLSLPAPVIHLSILPLWRCACNRRYVGERVERGGLACILDFVCQHLWYRAIPGPREWWRKRAANINWGVDL